MKGVETSTPGVVVYRGIPYAAAPVGDLRWKEPQPVKPWEGVKVADTFSAASVQTPHDGTNTYTPEFFFNGDPEFSEDCLYLNVWTNKAGKTDAKLPVAVWIHGGGFTGGWGHEIEMDGEAWAKKGVILVTFNYRLGVFGFLSHPLLSKELARTSGNFGILDQIAALKWVKNNIAAFGGDPSNVTVFGQSAGGRSVENLIQSPLTDGLFAKAIMMSAGGADPNQAITDNEAIENTTKEIFDAMGLTTIEKMREASTEEIFNLQSEYRKTGGKARLATSVIIDGYINHTTTSDAVESSIIKDIPYMMGYTRNDMGSRAMTITRFAEIRAEQGKPVYLYEFARPLADSETNPHPLKGSFHSSELWFVFNTLSQSDRPFVQSDYELSETMVDAWTNFAKFSNPDPDGELNWNLYSGENPQRKIFE